MLALVLDNTVRLVADYPRPAPESNEALIRIQLAGVCATDLEMLRGYKGGYRGVMGHEFVGQVVESPDPAWIGKRVVGDINVACGDCDMCRLGIPSQCRQRQAIGIIGRGGVFADYLALPLANLHLVPDGVSDEEAVFAEPLAAALQIPQMVPIQPNDQVVVLGDGRLGLLVAQVLRLNAAEVTLLGHHPERQALARSWGLLVERPDSDADIVVDCTGRPEGFSEALTLVRPRGTIVLKSTYAGAGEFDLSSVVVNEITIVGNRCGPFEPALRLLEEGLVDVRSLIDARYPLSEGPAALEHAGRRGTLKVLIQP